MALKMDLKGIFFMRSCYILLQIATGTVDRGQSTNKQSTNKIDTPSQYLGFFEKIKIKNKNILKQV